MKEETCPNCHQRYVLTFKTLHKTCTVASNEVDMLRHEILDELVVPVIEGVGYAIQPGHIDVFYTEE